VVARGNRTAGLNLLRLQGLQRPQPQRAFDRSKSLAVFEFGYAIQLLRATTPFLRFLRYLLFQCETDSMHPLFAKADRLSTESL
jgi:hypothetical protein